MYLIRLDDACEYMNIDKWLNVERLLDEYHIAPLVGIIPKCKDENFIHAYSMDKSFWNKALFWKDKGWRIALHGYNHIYCTESGGINPVNKRSEFAGLSFEEQKSKISKGYQILKEHDLSPDVFFAPAHTYDLNTLKALKHETDIYIISDTIANDIYYENGFYFIPQQIGSPKNVPFKFVTICLHPNVMDDDSFFKLQIFITLNIKNIVNAYDISLQNRNRNIYDNILKVMYFSRKMLLS